MSLTAIVWALLYGIALLGALVNPIFGLFGYLLEYFQRPALYWWGDDLPDLRWNFTIAVVAMAKVQKVTGIFVRNPPIFRMSCSPDSA